MAAKKSTAKKAPAKAKAAPVVEETNAERRAREAAERRQALRVAQGIAK